MVDTIKFSEMTDGGDIDNNKKTPGLKNGGNVLFNNPWTFLPSGSTAQRPTPSADMYYRLRFNTDDQVYEYYNAILAQWTQIQQSVFTQGPFVTYTADVNFPDAQNLGALADGLLKQTIALGIATIDIAVNGTDYFGPGTIVPPDAGGTGVDNGVNTITIGGNFEMSGAFTFLGTLTGNTSVTFPTSGTLATTAQIPTGEALTRVDDTNVTLTLGGSPSTALINATSLTLGWTGQLGLTRGGTNASLTASNGGIVYSTATAMAILSGTATANQILLSGASGAPSWSTATYPSTAGTSGNVLKSNGTNWVSAADTPGALTQNHIYVGDASNVAQDVAMSGDATIVASGALTIANSAVTNAKMANMNDQTIKGNVSGGAAAPSDLTKSQVLTMLSSPINVIATQTITATGAFTYTPTSGTKYAIFELQGGGGGSGGTTGTAGQSCVSGAGAGGAYMRILVTGSANLAAITGSVGIAGTAGSSGNNNGGTGGSTTLVINGGSTWTSAGGGFGTGQTSAAIAQIAGTAGTGGVNTTGTNGTLILASPGQNGGYGFSNGTNTIIIKSPPGGSSMLGRGGADTSSAGSAGGNYGAGASGYFNGSGSNQAGLAGSQGIVVITEFISV